MINQVSLQCFQFIYLIAFLEGHNHYRNQCQCQVIGLRQYYSEMECKENYRRVVKRRCTVRYQSNSIKGAEKLISPKNIKNGIHDRCCVIQDKCNFSHACFISPLETTPARAVSVAFLFITWHSRVLLAKPAASKHLFVSYYILIFINMDKLFN